ncbi:MAG: hypothetical protein FWH53_07550 [Leptospirales bacterium]|nr:hypothetical protein [Leptospirales bacterium]
MKLLKLSIIFLLMQLLLMQMLFFTSLYAQEDESANTPPDSITDIIPELPKDEAIVDNENENTITPDLTNKGKTEKDDDVQKKLPAKKKSEIKPVQKTEEIKTEDIKTEEIKSDKPDIVKIDESLLLIDEGNFKYRRIPDIKLIDKTPELIVKNIAVETPIEVSDQKKEKSYIDIWKILIVLFIVGIFILYVSRASGSTKMSKSNKTSRSRKVLNSYRK